jgi:hypothetical protein
MKDLNDLLFQKWEPLNKMKIEDLREECKTWRTLSSWYSDDLKYYLSHIGSQVRVVQRNYHGLLGDLLQPIFELKTLEIGLYDKVYDQNTGKYFMEKKIVRLPATSFLSIEFISERSLQEDVNEFDLAQILGSGGGDSL